MMASLKIPTFQIRPTICGRLSDSGKKASNKFLCKQDRMVEWRLTYRPKTGLGKGLIDSRA